MNKRLEIDRKKEIAAIAEKILKAWDCFFPKFDLIQLLQEKEGFNIVCQNMQDNTTGFILINDNEYIPETNTHKLIAINDKFKKDFNFLQRRRFIVAHEFGHALLHKNDDTLYAHRDAEHRKDMFEQEADYFAMCLLMPEELVRTILGNNFAKDMNFEKKITYIANAFNVTEKKACERLKELGYGIT